MYYHAPSYIAGISQAVMEYSNVRSHHFVAIFLIIFLVGCSHPLEIQGQGDVVSLSGERDCSKAEQPCENLVVFDYNETYTAVPKAGNQFVGWKGCGDQHPLCSYNISATTVRKQWFKTMPSLKAIFEPVPVPSTPTDVVVNAGLREVTVSWGAVSGATSYNLYVATESFGSPLDIDNYASYTGGNLLTGITATSHTLTNITGGTIYYFVVVAVNSGVTSDPSIERKGLPITGAINDTGITWGGDYPSGYNATCIGEEIAAQDCSHGRDASHNNDTDGSGGFSFTKLDASGNVLAASALEWSCVQDNVTGLIWEVKTDDEGLHDKDDLYSWYSTDSLTNGGRNGFDDEESSVCNGYNPLDSSTYCNTQAYTARVNANGLCGQNSWRLPSLKELGGIADMGKNYWPRIDAAFFPNTAHAAFVHHWTSTVSREQQAYAWVFDFRSGEDFVGAKSSSKSIRLVNGSNDYFENSFQRERYLKNNDNTVTDRYTDLMWQQCTYGIYGSGDCSQGEAESFTWQAALQQAETATFAGYSDWRLPNIKELRSLVSYSRGPAIDTGNFQVNWGIYPNEELGAYWSSSPSRDREQSWIIIFGRGFDARYDRNLEAKVRLVRGGS
jgi:hypothetical protein